MDWQEYTVAITPFAAKGLRKLSKKLGKTLFHQLNEAISGLKENPQGKTQELGGPLAAYRSLHVSRVRVVVKIVDVTVTVYVVAAGWHEADSRDDIYEQLTRALDEGVDLVPPGSPVDFDGNGTVDHNDLNVLLANWGPCPK